MDVFKNAFSSTLGKIAGCCGGLFIIAVLIGVIGGVGQALNHSSTSTSVPAKSDNSTLTTQPPSQVVTTVQTTPQVLLDVSGSGTKTTQKFTAASDWDMNWSYDCTSSYLGKGNFQVYVYNGDGSMSFNNSLVNQMGDKGANVEHYHTGGTFYLDVNSECSWHITAKG